MKMKFTEREVQIALNHHKRKTNSSYTEPTLLIYVFVKIQKFENIHRGRVVRIQAMLSEGTEKGGEFGNI